MASKALLNSRWQTTTKFSSSKLTVPSSKKLSRFRKHDMPFRKPHRALPNSPCSVLCPLHITSSASRNTLKACPRRNGLQSSTSRCFKPLIIATAVTDFQPSVLDCHLNTMPVFRITICNSSSSITGCKRPDRLFVNLNTLQHFPSLVCHHCILREIKNTRWICNIQVTSLSLSM